MHELLGAETRTGRYGGSFENRTRFLRQVASGIRTEAPGLALAVRLSAFDFVPFVPDHKGFGKPESDNYDLAFGTSANGVGVDLADASRFLRLLEELGIGLVSITAGSPYYCPHIQRPASYPPSDGYLPPEDPLVGVARQINATAELKRRHPGLVLVGSGYSYLQEWLPRVASAAVERGLVDCVGLGRVALSYPSLPADTLAGKPTERRALCRTFSDCTTAPRNGLISGCYPLDAFYKGLPENEMLKQAKRRG